MTIAADKTDATTTAGDHAAHHNDLATAANAATAHAADTANNPHAVTKGQVGLGNADNTSDAAKPVSTAQQTALDLKAPLASPALTGAPTAPTQAAGDSSTKLATTAYADRVIVLGSVAMPTEAKSEPPAGRHAALSTQGILVSGTLRVGAVQRIRAGVQLTGIAAFSATGATNPTNQWFALIRVSDRAYLAVTADDLTTAWGNNTKKKLAFSPGTYTPSVDIDVYIGIMVAASTTVPQLVGWPVPNQIAGEPPIICGTSSTGLTGPPTLPATAGAISQSPASFYAYTY